MGGSSKRSTRSTAGMERRSPASSHTRGGDPLRDPADGQRARCADSVVPDRRRRRPRQYDIAWVQTRSRRSTPSTGSSRCTWIRAASRGRGRSRLLREPGKDQTHRRLAADAQWFEDRMPWNPEYRKPSVTGIVANAIDVVVEAGDSGPVTPVGINLPNDQRIREQYGASPSRSRTSVRRTTVS